LAKGGEIVYLVFAMWEERKDVMSWQSSLDVAGLQEEDKYKKMLNSTNLNTGAPCSRPVFLVKFDGQIFAPLEEPRFYSLFLAWGAACVLVALCF
jgi:hypothetical protein